MNERQTITVKNSRVNAPHILSSGYLDAVLLGSSDTQSTEQLLTIRPIKVRYPRGTVTVLLQLDYPYGLYAEAGRGDVTLLSAVRDNRAFDITAIHNLPAGVERHVRIGWFAFGYEDFTAPSVDLTTTPDADEKAYPKILIGTWGTSVANSGSVTQITLPFVPVSDATLIVWTDRIPCFYGTDLTVSGKIVSVTEQVPTGTAVVVTYTSKLES